MCATEFAATETTTFTLDGHDYIVRHDTAKRRHTISCAYSQETLGHITESECGEYFIVENYNNPIGMGEHHHVNSATPEDLAHSLISGSY